MSYQTRNFNTQQSGNTKPIWSAAGIRQMPIDPFIDGKVSSKNNYTPIISKGKWLPDADINLSYTFLFNRGIYFYTKELNGVDINSMPLSKASSIIFGWLNFKAGYNYSELSFFNPNDTTSFKYRITEDKFGSVFFKGNANLYWYPSRDETPWLTIYTNIGYEYRTNDNNYSKMTEVDVKQSKIYQDSTNGNIDVIEELGKSRYGKFIIGTSHSIPFNLSFLISNKDKDFYVGLNFYVVQKFLNGISSTDLGSSISLPLQKKSKDGKTTIANFTLRGDIQDINNNLNAGTSVINKVRLGFTVGVPLIPRHNVVTQ